MTPEKLGGGKMKERKKIHVVVLEFWDPDEREKFQVEVKHANKEVALRNAREEIKAYVNEGYEFLEEWTTWEWGAA